MQGTPPFIALELLIHGSYHRVAHDLESVLYVLLVICTHLNGPLGKIRDPPLYGKKSYNHPSLMREWFSSTENLANLGHMKYSHVMAHFETHVLEYISPYFFPLKKYIVDFRDALFPLRGHRDGAIVTHSTATPQDIIKIFKAALLDDQLITDAKVACNSKNHNKRSLPGELVVATNCWDAVVPNIPRTSKKPKLSPSTTRNAILLTKGARNLKTAKGP